VPSGFRREVAENFAPLGYYAARSDNFLPTFWDKLSVLSLGFKMRMWSINCPENAIVNYHYSLRNNPEQRSSQYDIRLYQFVIEGFVELSGSEKNANKSLSISSLAIRVFVNIGMIM
jgi:hypothetical protein